MFFVIIPSIQKTFIKKKRLNRKRGGVSMSNELIMNCIGKVCNISTGSLGSSFNKVKIIQVVDNWIKVEGKGKIDLINIDFIQNIKILSDDK